MLPQGKTEMGGFSVQGQERTMKSIKLQHTLQGQEAVLYFTEQTAITVIDMLDFFFKQ